MTSPLGVITTRWKSIGARRLFREVNERGFSLPLGSVTKAGGVEFRADLNFQVWDPGDDISAYKRVLPGDFVIGLRSFQSGIGASSISALVSPAYTVLRPLRPLIHRFYAHLFKSAPIISQLNAMSSGIRQGRTISAQDALSMQLPDPAEEEQRAIADFLDAETARIDNVLHRRSSMRLLLAEHRTAYTQELLARYGADLRGGGKSTKLGRVARLVAGGTPDTADESLWAESGEGVPWVAIGDMSGVEVVTATARSLTKQGRHSRRLAVGRVGTVLFAMYASVGAVSRLGVPATWNQAIVGIEAVGSLAETRFIEVWLRAMHPHLPLLFRSNTQDNLNASQVSGLTFPILSLEDQLEIVVAVEAARAQTGTAVHAIETQAALLREHRQALITAAVTGQIDVSTASGRGVPA